MQSSFNLTSGLRNDHPKLLPMIVPHVPYIRGPGVIRSKVACGKGQQSQASIRLGGRTLLEGIQGAADGG